MYAHAVMTVANAGVHPTPPEDLAWWKSFMLNVWWIQAPMQAFDAL
jgi:hypothetical protein